jgi:hypothetical protein
MREHTSKIENRLYMTKRAKGYDWTVFIVTRHLLHEGGIVRRDASTMGLTMETTTELLVHNVRCKCLNDGRLRFVCS